MGFPDINTLEPLADALGISLTELMRCSKEKEENPDKVILASIEIANIQRKKALHKIVIGGIACATGVCTVIYAIRLFAAGSWSLMFRGNDGATSMFVVGKAGNFLPAIIFAMGIIVFLCGIFTVLRSNNNDKFPGAFSRSVRYNKNRRPGRSRQANFSYKGEVNGETGHDRNSRSGQHGEHGACTPDP